MKFKCTCGATIIDQTDALPYKGYIIPDQEWFPVHEEIDIVIGDVAAGMVAADDASMKIRKILNRSTRTIHQCMKCGRLHIEDWLHMPFVFEPEPGDVYTELLKSIDEDEDDDDGF